MNSQNVVILGSTGSIGENTLQVIRNLAPRFQIVGLAAGNRFERLAEQAVEFKVPQVAIADSALAGKLKSVLPDSIRVVSGEDALIEMVSRPEVDIVLCAIVGTAGLKPVIRALELGKTVALASKEVLVMAGEWVMETLRKYNGKLIPVDSEHSAILQCLHGRQRQEVRRLILTASGGPFRGACKEDLVNITPEQALRHPTWSMGRKISLDSATLMNKALEWIEAAYLFDVPSEKMEAVIHPQSIIHSMVEFVDGTLLAQMGEPDMKSPIQYALTGMEKCPAPVPLFDFTRHHSLTFERVDETVFPSLRFARFALASGGVLPAVLNAANEVAAERFFAGNIPFTGIFNVAEKSLEHFDGMKAQDFNALLDADSQARAFARLVPCG